MSDFWNGKKVLLTGHTGFKGSWLALWLQQRGAEVVGFSLPPPTKPSLFEDARVADGMISMEGDVRMLEPLCMAFAEHQPVVVLHLAAQALVRYSYTHPVETYDTNVMGVVNVLEAVRKTPSVRSVVIVTSDKCYENREWIWGYRENEPMGGHDPYSSSKGCAELVTAAYRRSFFGEGHTHNATASAGNVVGGGDWADDRLVPDMVRAFRQGQPVLIRNPQAVRPWQHVLEPLRGYLMLAERLFQNRETFAEAWNFGPDSNCHQPVQSVVKKLCALWSSSARWEQDPAGHPHEAQALRLDNTRAREHLRWQPALELDAALRMTADWYKEWEPGRNMRALTETQIRSYEEAVKAR